MQIGITLENQLLSYSHHFRLFKVTLGYGYIKVTLFFSAPKIATSKWKGLKKWLCFVFEEHNL